MRHRRSMGMLYHNCCSATRSKKLETLARLVAQSFQRLVETTHMHQHRVGVCDSKSTEVNSCNDSTHPVNLNSTHTSQYSHALTLSTAIWQSPHTQFTSPPATFFLLTDSQYSHTHSISHIKSFIRTRLMKFLTCACVI